MDRSAFYRAQVERVPYQLPRLSPIGRPLRANFGNSGLKGDFANEPVRMPVKTSFAV
jgi:hypothetical protein